MGDDNAGVELAEISRQQAMLEKSALERNEAIPSKQTQTHLGAEFGFLELA